MIFLFQEKMFPAKDIWFFVFLVNPQTLLSVLIQ